MPKGRSISIPSPAPIGWLEYMSFGPWLGRCRNAQLVRLIGARHALLLGDGDGRFLARLLEANSTLTADVVDSSRSMLAILERRVRRSGPQARRRICLHRADALEWNPTGRYDLIVSHFFLDCFSTQQLEQLFDAVLPHALPGVQWIAEFAIPRNAFAAYLARRISVCCIKFSVGLPGFPCAHSPTTRRVCSAAASSSATSAVTWLAYCVPSMEAASFLIAEHP